MSKKKTDKSVETRNIFLSGFDIALNVFHALDGRTLRGRLSVDEVNELARFEEYAWDRPHRVRNTRVYRNEHILVMQRPDGRYVLTTEFDWSGTGSTWTTLMGICREVYHIIKEETLSLTHLPSVGKNLPNRSSAIAHNGEGSSRNAANKSKKRVA